jgi:hypothetical protein
MSAWKDPAPHGFDMARKPTEQYTEQEVLNLESVIATYYTQTFFNSFGRAAMTPHRL